jgi:hypothetical protein
VTIVTSAVEPVAQRRRPRLQYQGRLDLVQLPVRTAGIAAQPGRAATLSGRNFLPHHDPMMISGAALITSCEVMMRSFAACRVRKCAKQSSPPATSISSDTQPMPVISGSSHSSK